MLDDISTIENHEFANLSGRFPEFWMLMLSGAAWLALATIAANHTHYAGMPTNWWHWMLMVMAMMLPLQIEAVRLTAEHSLWPRRNRGILGFLLGYLSVWAVAGALLAWVFQIVAIPSRISWMEGAAIGLFIETAWVISPCKRMAASMCHRTLPLSPSGWRADRDCLRYGLMSGYGCALNCWPLMLLCWLSGHSLVAMLIAFGLAWADRHAAPNYGLRAMVTAGIGAAFVVFSRIQ